MMNNAESFKLFINLVLFDQSIIKCKQSLEVLKQKQNVHFNTLKKLASESESGLLQLKMLKKTVDEKERYMKDLDEKEKALKERSGLVSGDREYKSIKKESEILRAKQYDFEQELLQAWDQYEICKKQTAEKETTLDEQEEILQRELNTLDEQIVKNETEIKELEMQRPEYEKSVPAEWLSKYCRMRSSVANPVVPVESGSCSACFGAASQHELNALSNYEILPCRSCFRLVYDPAVYAHSVNGDAQ